jgi:hypothetical protein
MNSSLWAKTIDDYCILTAIPAHISKKIQGEQHYTFVYSKVELSLHKIVHLYKETV